MNYRDRIYEKYTTTVHRLAEDSDVRAFDRWGDAYDTYMRGWLPVEKDAPIVDVACGYGRLLRYFTKRGFTNVLGVDISPEQVEYAKKLHSNVVQSDVLEFLKTHPGEFALITAFDIIEHFQKDEVLDFLDACFLALRPGGRLVLQTPNGDTPWGLMHRYNDFTHELGFNPTSMGWILKLCGFERFEAREQGPVPRSITSVCRFTLWKLLRAKMLFHNLVETGSMGSGVLTRVFISSAVRPHGGNGAPS
ncbi:MAG: class I SAM-dependent methyltransferase [Phycisphaerales bacterium]|nr:class I SAM-dependent methyltransferase [Phycisphaerales bacterium]